MCSQGIAYRMCSLSCPINEAWSSTIWPKFGKIRYFVLKLHNFVHNMETTVFRIAVFLVLTTLGSFLGCFGLNTVLDTGQDLVNADTTWTIPIQATTARYESEKVAVGLPRRLKSSLVSRRDVSPRVQSRHKTMVSIKSIKWFKFYVVFLNSLKIFEAWKILR